MRLPSALSAAALALLALSAGCATAGETENVGMPPDTTVTDVMPMDTTDTMTAVPLLR